MAQYATEARPLAEALSDLTGSILVKTIQRLVVPPALKMPEGVSGWFNAYDDRDVVALRALDSSTFPITPPIRNKADVNNHTTNRHGIVGYLDDAEVARWICEALTM